VETTGVNRSPDYRRLKTGYPFLDGKLYTEFKAKYFAKKGG
jgi:hypothetical protein